MGNYGKKNEPHQELSKKALDINSNYYDICNTDGFKNNKTVPEILNNKPDEMKNTF